jgi:hypothetical protein
MEILLNNKNNKKKNNIFNKIVLLPIEISNIIYSFIPIITTLFLNKKSYCKHHTLVRKHILQYENYIRAMIRRDNDFVFKILICENFERWLYFKNYSYKSTIFSNYIYFLLEYCIENESDKCKQNVNYYIINSGLSQNQHKKNTSKTIRWNN